MRTSLKILILITVGASLAAALVPSLYAWLALSWSGIKQFYFWQLLTYVLVEPPPLSVGFFLQLAFNMYVLWMFGTSVMERAYGRLFYLLYFGAALFGGLAALLIPQATLSGSTVAVYAVLTVWMMINPGSQLLLFFALPFKAQWLIAALIACSLLLSLSNSQWVEAVSLAASILYAYFFALLVWREEGPFPLLRPFERKFLRLVEKKNSSSSPRSKIFDIKSGEPVLDDAQFMDAMLDKISRRGEGSLTAAEKKRMQSISSRKK